MKILFVQKENLYPREKTKKVEYYLICIQPINKDEGLSTGDSIEHR